MFIFVFYLIFWNVLQAIPIHELICINLGSLLSDIFMKYK